MTMGSCFDVTGMAMGSRFGVTGTAMGSCFGVIGTAMASCFGITGMPMGSSADVSLFLICCSKLPESGACRSGCLGSSGRIVEGNMSVRLRVGIFCLCFRLGFTERWCGLLKNGFSVKVRESECGPPTSSWFVDALVGSVLGILCRVSRVG